MATVPNASGKGVRSMNGWETLEKAIPRASAEAIAAQLGVSADTVRRWCREPLSDEAETATGRRSPLDAAVDLIRAVYLENPQGAAAIVEHLRAHLAQLQARHAAASQQITPSQIEARINEAQSRLTELADLLRANRERSVL